MRFRLTVLFLLLPVLLHSHNLDSVLNVLDHTLERRDTHFMKHEHKIDSIKSSLAHISLDNLPLIADTYHNIFNQYKSYQGDSAAVYAEREYKIAMKTANPELIARAQIDRLYSRITGGIFTEAVDIVKETDLSEVSDSTKGNFYFYCNRLYTDMSNYADGTFSDNNSRLAKAYSDSVINYLPPDSYRSQYSTIFKTLEDMSTDQKIEIFMDLKNRKDIDNAEKAMIVSILGDLYVWKDDLKSSAYYKAESAILDILSAKRETTSKNDLARLLFEFGDVERANKYINMALEDAEFFHARHRMGEISKILPLVEHARYLNVDKERNKLRSLTVLFIIMSVALAVIVVIVMRQKKRIHDSRKLIEKHNIEVEEANKNLALLNDELHTANKKIEESNRIKDEYIGYGFYANAEYINKLETLNKALKIKLRLHQYSDLESLIKESDIRKEKENMKNNFDKIFLRLFPSFIKDYKALFPPEDEDKSDSSAETLTPEMRIFALIRLGIEDCSDIARFLNYSVNTVNTYKTKAKNRSFIPNDEFETKIMEIKSVS